MIGKILTAAAIGFIWLVIWSLCRIASLADQDMEREWMKHEREHREKDTKA